MDPRPSRRDKLLSIPVSHLLPLVRSSIFKLRNDFDVIFVLRSCADRGDSESIWLLENLEGIPEYEWIAALSTIQEDTPIGNYYRALAHNEKAIWIELLRKSAEAGFVPAMVRFGSLIRDMDLLKRSYELNDPEAALMLAILDKPRQFEFLYKAATLGNIEALYRVVRHYPEKLSLGEWALFSARHILFNGRLGNREIASLDDGTMFLVGRELEGFQRLWTRACHHYTDCVQLYLDTIHRTRRAALQTIAGLRPILGRDVARMIGRMVFFTCCACAP